MPAGRPKGSGKFTPKMGEKLCQLIAEGSSASKACKSVGISMMTLYRWARENQEFSLQLSRAREDQADTFADQMCDIADDEEDVARAKLKIDARKWVAARMKPKSWGEKVTSEITGANGGPITVRNASDLTDDQLAAIAAASRN